jgi:hypothetical protein
MTKNPIKVYKKVELGQEGRLNMIDDEAIFKARKESIYVDQLGNNTVVKDYESWWSHFKKENSKILTSPKSNMSWIKEHYKVVEQYIYDKYVSNASPVSGVGLYKFNTVRNHLQSFCTVLLTIDKHRFREYIRSHYMESFKYGNLAQEKVQNQKFTQDELDQYVHYVELIEKREQMKEVYEKSKTGKNMNALKNHMAYLVLCINTMIPPLRLDFLDMIIYRESKEPPNDNDNYLWVKSDTDMVVVINTDKVSHHELKKGKRGMYPLKNEIEGDGVQYTKGIELMKIFADSFKSLPRDSVLTNLKDYQAKDTSHMTPSTYDQSILHWLFKPRKPTQNMLRKAYVNYFYRLEGTNINIHKQIANRMRHSYATAVENYLKINIDPSKQPTITGSVVKLLPSSLEPLVVRTKPRFDPVKNAKIYREKHKARLEEARKENYKKNKDKILGQKILYHLNNNLIKEPRKASIVKYGLTKDTETGLWNMKDIETVKIEMKKENPLPIVEEQKKEETKRSTRVKKPNPKFG